MDYKKYEWRTGRSQIYKHYYHLVFVTKYRRSVFTKDILERARIIFKETCEQMDCDLIEFHGEDDHVHLLVSISPKSLKNILTTKESHHLKKELLNQFVKEKYDCERTNTI